MKYYTQFLETRTSRFDKKLMEFTSCEPYCIESLGSDGIFILDGRNNLETMIRDSVTRMKKLSKLHDYTGFKIMKGDLKRSTCIYASTK